jgi:hypothetical protein
MPPRGTSEIPLAFANILSRGRCTESELGKCFPQLSTEMKTLYFVAIQEEQKIASPKERSDRKPNEIHLKFQYHNLFQDIRRNLNLVYQYTVIVNHKLAKLGQLSVKRIRQDHLDIYFLSHVSDETVKELISFSSQTGHPGGVIVPAVRGFMTENAYNRLSKAGFDLFGVDNFFCIRDNHFAVSDPLEIKRILESDDSLCPDEEWGPRQVAILDKTFLVELPPSWYNMWKNAFETGSYDDSDLEFYDEQKECVAFRVVNETTTIEFKVNFRIDPSLFWNDW